MRRLAGPAAVLALALAGVARAAPPAGSPPPFSLGAQVGVYNLQPSSLPKARARLAAVRAGQAGAQFRVLTIGMSTDRGVGSAAAGATSFAASTAGNSWPTQFCARAVTVGMVPGCSAQSFLADGNLTAAAYHGNDPRVTPGTGWFTSGSEATLGGFAFASASSANGPLTFTPQGPFDTWKVHYVGSAFAASFTVSIDGTVVATQATNGSGNANGVVTGTTALGAHTLSIQQTAGTTGLWIQGVETYAAAAPQMVVLNAGWSGGTPANLTFQSNPWTGVNAIGSWSPDLCVLSFDINNWRARSLADPANGTAAFASQMQAIIAACATAGADVVLVDTIPTNPADTPVSFQTPYLAVLQQLSASNGAPLIDTYARWVSWDFSNGLYSTVGGTTDNVHFSSVGYGDWAQLMLRVLGSL